MDGRFCTQELLMELEVKPKGGAQDQPGLQEPKRSLENGLGAACGPEGVFIL